MKTSKRRFIFLGAAGFVAIAVFCLLTLPRFGEMQTLTNRMLQDNDVRELLKKTQGELAATGGKVQPLSMNLNSPRVGDIYRGSTGRVLLVDRLSLFGVWMEPRIKGAEVNWQCSTAFTSLRIPVDCDLSSL